MTGDLYDTIGIEYRSVRLPDSRLAAQIRAALADASSVLNVGAGSGSYEPGDLPTIALEPSKVMISQRPRDAAPVVRGRAEQLPFADDTFAVGMALFTVHHWSDPDRGLRELERVSRRQVVLTWDPVLFADRFWFARDYLTNSHQKAERGTARWVADSLDASASVQPVPIPADCTDGFYAAYWARPEAYLDPAVRSGISALALEKDEVVSEALLRLSEDLTTGAWDQRYGTLRSAAYLDVGYRLIHT